MAVLEGLKIRDVNGEEFEEEFPEVFEEEFAPDPAPNEKPRRSRKEPVVRAAPVRRRSVNVVAKEVGNDLGGAFEMMAALWQMAGDECCAPVLEEQAKPIGAALANILKRYPRLLEKLSDSDYLSFALSAAMVTSAVKPVVTAVYRNHVSKEGTHDHDDDPTGDELAAHADQFVPNFSSGRPTR